MNGHPHLLDQQDDMEHLAPALPYGPITVSHAGPPAAKPVTQTPLAYNGQNAGSSSPPSMTSSPVSPPVKSSFAHGPIGHQKPSRQEPADVQKAVAGQQARQRYQSRRSSAVHDHALSRQGSEQGTQNHVDELSQKLSDLNLRDRQQAAGDRARRHGSPFAEVYQPVRRFEQAEGRSRRHRPFRQVDLADVPSIPQKTHQPETATVVEFDPSADQSSSLEWEDREWGGEDDEHSYEEVAAHRTKTASNGNEPESCTNRDLKHTSLVWAESSAKMMYLCSRKMYEVMWTSQTSQRLRRSAIHTTRNASGHAAGKIGTLVKGGVNRYVSNRCIPPKAARRSPREALRLSAARVVRLSRMKLAAVAAPVLNLPVEERPDEEPESDIEDNWDFCDDVEDEQPSDSRVLSVDDYTDEGLDIPGLYEDDIYGSQ